ncbi:hypothetical protein KY342_00935, partial [Candidatus Woesearchaeota archaeon]|nr:hypothetical protein [Candidatus Woesearchaeota archaeon]
EKRGTLNSLLLAKIVKTFEDIIEDTFEISEENAKKLYAEINALKSQDQSDSSPIVNNNLNVNGPITDNQLKKLLVDLINKTVASKSDENNNVNINVYLDSKKPVQAKKSTDTKKPSSRLTVKDLKDYVDKRADEIITYIKNQPAPDISQLKTLISDAVKDIKTQYTTIDNKLDTIDTTADATYKRVGQVKNTVDSMDKTLASVEGNTSRTEGKVNSIDVKLRDIEKELKKLDELKNGQIAIVKLENRLIDEHKGLSTEHKTLGQDHRELREQHAELRQGQSAILSKLGDLEVLYTQLDAEVKSFKPYISSTLSSVVNQGFADLKSKIDAKDIAMRDLIDRKADDLRRRIDAVKPYNDAQLRIYLSKEFDKIEKKIDAVKPYTDAQLRIYLNQEFDKIEKKIDAVKPNYSQLITPLTNIAAVLGQVKGKVDGLANDSSAVIATLSGMAGTISKIEGEISGLNYNDLTQLINDKYTEAVKSFGNLNTAIAEKTGEIKTYIVEQLKNYASKDDLENIFNGKLTNLPNPISKDDLKEIIDEKLKNLPSNINKTELEQLLTEKLKDLPYIKKQDLEELLAEKLKGISSLDKDDINKMLKKLDCATQEDLDKIYRTNKSILDSLDEISRKLNSIGQSYAQQPIYTQPQPVYTQPQPAVQDNGFQDEVTQAVCDLSRRIGKIESYQEEAQQKQKADQHAAQKDKKKTLEEKYPNIVADVDKLRNMIEGKDQDKEDKAKGDETQQPKETPAETKKDAETESKDKTQEQAQQKPKETEQQKQTQQEQPKQEVPDPVKKYLALKKQIENEITSMQLDIMSAYSEISKEMLQVQGDIRQTDMSKLEDTLERSKYKLRLYDSLLKAAKEKMFIENIKDDSHAETVIYGWFGFSQPIVDQVVDEQKSKLQYEHLWAQSETKVKVKKMLPATMLQESDTKKVLEYTGIKSEKDPLEKVVLINLIEAYENQGRVTEPQIKKLNRMSDAGLSYKQAA